MAKRSNERDTDKLEVDVSASRHSTPEGPELSVEPFTKQEDLQRDREFCSHSELTTDQGVPISHTDDSLKAGRRGPTLLEDFHLREKITRFDHERIPERVVHARGSGAHGTFRVYQSLEQKKSGGTA